MTGEASVSILFLGSGSFRALFGRGVRGFHSTFPEGKGSFVTMALPYKIATLLYCFNEADDVLLLERAQEPNLGCWSPCGGKLIQEIGESPYACACREAEEEIGLGIKPPDLHLTGIISEHGYQGHAHWLMFLFEVKARLKTLPPVHREGRFEFFKKTDLAKLKMPQTDLEQIWPLFWKYRGGFFSAHCHCVENGCNQWTIEESVLHFPAQTPNS